MCVCVIHAKVQNAKAQSAGGAAPAPLCATASYALPGAFLPGVLSSSCPTGPSLVLSNLAQPLRLQAKEFNEAVRLSGLILTKLDGTARGGAHMCVCVSVRVCACTVCVCVCACACACSPTRINRPPPACKDTSHDSWGTVNATGA